jgi:hypothetical protein
MLNRCQREERAYIDAEAQRQPRGPAATPRPEETRLHSLSAGLVALALLAAPDADTADCSTLPDRYTAAVAQVVDSLSLYAKCVSASEKRDDCASQMQALDNAHDDFVDAVADANACH